MDFMKIAILEILRNMQNHKQNHRFSRHEKFQKTRFGENAETTDTIFFAIQPKRGRRFCVTRPAAAPASQGGFWVGDCSRKAQQIYTNRPGTRISASPYLPKLPPAFRPQQMNTNRLTASKLASTLGPQKAPDSNQGDLENQTGAAKRCARTRCLSISRPPVSTRLPGDSTISRSGRPSL